MAEGFGADDPFSGSVVREMVAEIDPGIRVRDVTPIVDGTDAVYRVDAEDGRFVLKAAVFVDPPRFRVEPRMLALVDEHTDVPVPTPVGFVDDHDDLPAPFFLMEYVPDGRPYENTDGLDTDALSRTARDAGRIHAELHSVGSFDAFGSVRPARDCDRTALSLPSSDAGVGVVDPYDSWSDCFADMLEASLAELDPETPSEVTDGRFADLHGYLETRAESAVETVRAGDPEPVLAHVDYRPGNLLLRENGDTAAVLDWGNVRVTSPAYCLANTEQYLCGRAPLESDRRERIHDALLSGYDRPLPDDFDARYRAGLFATALAPLVWFDHWYGEDAERENRLREFAVAV